MFSTLANTRRRFPGGPFLAILSTLALGIAGATIVFSMISGTGILATFQGEGTVFWVMEEYPRWGAKTSPSPATFEAWRGSLKCCQVEGLALGEGGLRSDGGARRIYTASVTSGLFGLVGESPLAGSLLSSPDSDDGGGIALISRQLANQRFGNPRKAIGQTIFVDGNPLGIVGVVSNRFLGKFSPGTEIDVVLPLQTERVHRVQALIQLGNEITPAQAKAELTASRRGQPEPTGASEEAHPVLLSPEELLDTGQRRLLSVVILGGALLLLVTGANVTHLLATQAEREAKEASIRWAIGAGRLSLASWRASRALGLTASACLIAGLVSVVVLELFRVRMPVELRFLAAPQVDPEALGLAIIIGVALMLGPVVVSTLRMTQLQLVQDLRGTSRPGRKSFVGRTLGQLHVVSLAAVSLVAGIACWLVASDLYRSGKVDLGFESIGLQTISVTLPGDGQESERACGPLAAAAVERFSAVPGVEASSIAIPTPPRGAIRFGEIDLDTESLDSRSIPGVGASWVGPGYAAAMKQPILAGRDFTVADLSPGIGTILISEELSKAFGSDPNQAVGRSIAFGEDTQQIVGVLGDLGVAGSAEPFGPSRIYWPLAPHCPSFTILARAPEELSQVLRQLTVGLASDLVVEVAPIEDRLKDALAGPRFLMAVLLGLTGLSFGLTLLGVHGVVSGLLERERRQIALRLALGATQRKLRRWIFRKGFSGCLAGFLIGLLVSFPLCRLVSLQLKNAEPNGILPRLVVAGLLFLAAAVPIWRATRRLSDITPAEILSSL